jgi:hypothetical protein
LCYPQNTVGFVSESPYKNAFQDISQLHKDIKEETLTAGMTGINYTLILKESYPCRTASCLSGWIIKNVSKITVYFSSATFAEENFYNPLFIVSLFFR